MLCSIGCAASQGALVDCWVCVDDDCPPICGIPFHDDVGFEIFARAKARRGGDRHVVDGQN
jgi:hypothetical protein